KGVEQTDQRRSLTEVIMKVEQLKSAEPRRAQVCLNLFLVTLELEASRCPGKFLILLKEAVRVHRVAKDFEITRPQIAFEFLDDVVIGVRHPLPDFMRDDRDVDVGERLPKVTTKPRRLAAQHQLIDALN